MSISNAYTIRPVCPTDIDALVGLCEEHATFEKAAYDPAGKAERLRDALFSLSPRLIAWVALLGDQSIIGYASAAREYSTWNAREFLHMDCLFVQSRHRGAGIGAHLLVAVLEFARKSGIHEMQWQTPQWNRDARRFYQRQGARDQLKWRFKLSICDSS